jgi:hypothetical protein
LELEMLKRGMFFDVIDWSKDPARCPSTGEALARGCLSRRQLRKDYTPAVAQVAAVANASTATMNIAVSNFDRAHMWITPRFHQNYLNW